ncbi:MGMT family protein [Leucobacter sp. GX24907]
MPSPEFVEAVLATVERIPPGRVMTYGDVAFAVGSNSPRGVGRVMALFGHAVSWWRVVPASGKPPQGHSRLALPHYLAEATPLRPAGAREQPGRIRSGRADPGPLGAGRTSAASHDDTALDPDDYRLALSKARLPYDHEIYQKATP